MKIGEKIHNLRLKRNMTLEELGDKVGVGKSTVRKWENGMIANMKRDKIAKVAAALEVSPAYLMGWTDEPTIDDPKTSSTPADFNATVIELPESTMIPVYGSIAAGVPLEAVQDISGYIDIPSEWIVQGKTVIGLKIKGDSMYPSYFEGDIVIIQCDTEYNTGDDCAVYINGYDATIKRIKLLEDGIELIPLNNAYPPKRYSPGEFSILGKVIELRRQI